MRSYLLIIFCFFWTVSSAYAQQHNTSDGTTYQTNDSAFKGVWDSTNDTYNIQAAPPGTAGNTITWTDGLTVNSDGSTKMVLGYNSNTCNSGIEGAIRYNSSVANMEFCDGSSWKSIGGGLVGTSKVVGAASCGWTINSTSWTKFNTVDSDCNASTVSGSASAPSEGKIPAIKFANLSAGDYEVVFNGQLASYTVGNECVYRITDGTSSAGWSYVQGTYEWEENRITAIFSYASDQTNKTFYIEGKRVWGSGACWIDNYSGDWVAEFWLKRL